MNNSKITQNTLSEEPQVDTKPMIRERQEKIAKLIEALDSICQSGYWKHLEKELFQPALNSAINQLCIEKNDRKVAELQGEIRNLSKYADLKGLSNIYRMELKKIDEQLKVAN